MYRLEKIREREKKSHIDAYTTHALYQDGSWLKKPVKTVLELLPCFDGYRRLRVLDLGCGVGRNCIAIAQYFSSIACRIDCVDILELAIEKLNRNASEYGVGDSIHGIVSPLEEVPICPDTYDLILAVSALEHVDSESSFSRLLTEIRDGMRENGIFCLIVNSEVREFDKQTGRQMPAQFEVNLPGEEFQKKLNDIFGGWTVLKSNSRAQRYDIPRESAVHDLHTQVVTFVAKKSLSNEA